MTVNHRVGTGHVGGRLSNLALLGEDAQTVAGQFFEQPGMYHIEAMVLVAFGSAVPGDAGDSVLRCLKLYDLSINGEAEGPEEEGSVGIELRLTGLLVASVGGVGIILLPHGGMGEVGPHVGSFQSLYNHFVAGKVVSGARQILLGPMNLVQYFVFLSLMMLLK